MASVGGSCIASVFCRYLRSFSSVLSSVPAARQLIAKQSMRGACLCFGIASTGPNEFRERGSNRLIDLRGPQPFPSVLALG